MPRITQALWTVITLALVGCATGEQTVDHQSTSAGILKERNANGGTCSVIFISRVLINDVRFMTYVTMALAPHVSGLGRTTISFEVRRYLGDEPLQVFSAKLKAREFKAANLPVFTIHSDPYSYVMRDSISLDRNDFWDVMENGEVEIEVDSLGLISHPLRVHDIHRVQQRIKSCLDGLKSGSPRSVV